MVEVDFYLRNFSKLSQDGNCFFFFKFRKKMLQDLYSVERFSKNMVLKIQNLQKSTSGFWVSEHYPVDFFFSNSDFYQESFVKKSSPKFFQKSINLSIFHVELAIRTGRVNKSKLSIASCFFFFFFLVIGNGGASTDSRQNVRITGKSALSYKHTSQLYRQWATRSDCRYKLLAMLLYIYCTQYIRRECILHRCISHTPPNLHHLNWHCTHTYTCKCCISSRVLLYNNNCALQQSLALENESLVDIQSRLASQPVRIDRRPPCSL